MHSLSLPLVSMHVFQSVFEIKHMGSFSISCIKSNVSCDFVETISGHTFNKILFLNIDVNFQRFYASR